MLNLAQVVQSVSRLKVGSTGVLAESSNRLLFTILKAPYTVQAPFGNWKFHQESCEEAALLMYHDFMDGDERPNIPAAEGPGPK